MQNTGFSAAVTPLRDWVVGDVVTRALWILLASVALVFLVAAANVANLFLVRLDARRREIAMRMALGAGRVAPRRALPGRRPRAVARGRRVRCRARVRRSRRVARERARRHSAARPRSGSGWHERCWCRSSLALVTGLVFAVVPIANARVDVQTLREGSRTLTSSRRRHAVRGALVAGQVALALVLLAAAGLMVRSFRNLRSVPAGIRRE